MTLGKSSSIYVITLTENLMAKLKAIFLLGTLKADKEILHTQILAEFLVNHLICNDTESEIIPKNNYVRNVYDILTK